MPHSLPMSGGRRGHAPWPLPGHLNSIRAAATVRSLACPAAVEHMLRGRLRVILSSIDAAATIRSLRMSGNRRGHAPWPPPGHLAVEDMLRDRLRGHLSCIRAAATSRSPRVAVAVEDMLRDRLRVTSVPPHGCHVSFTSRRGGRPRTCSVIASGPLQFHPRGCDASFTSHWRWPSRTCYVAASGRLSVPSTRLRRLVHLALAVAVEDMLRGRLRATLSSIHAAATARSLRMSGDRRGHAPWLPSDRPPFHPRGCDDSLTRVSGGRRGHAPWLPPDRPPFHPHGCDDSLTRMSAGRRGHAPWLPPDRPPFHPRALRRFAHLHVRWPSRTCYVAASGPSSDPSTRVRHLVHFACPVTVEDVLRSCLRTVLRSIRAASFGCNRDHRTRSRRRRAR